MATLWNAIPIWLRRFVGYGFAAGIALTMVVLAFLSFPMLTDYIKEKLGVPTRSDVQSVTEAVQVATQDQMLGMAVFAARQRSEQDSVRNAAMFDTLSTTLIEPGIKRLKSLEQQVAHITAIMNASQGLMIEQVDVSKDTRSRLSMMQQEMGRSTTDETQQAILQKLEALSTVVEEIKKSQRNTKVKL